MESMPSSLRLTHSQLHDQSHAQAQAQNQTHPDQEYPPPPPPAKRRRANSVNPSLNPSAQPTNSSPAAYWPSPFIHPLQSLDRSRDSSISRDDSPDQLSRLSTGSNWPTSGPQLRKKPKSSSIKNNNILRAVTAAIPKSPSLPALPSSSQPDTVPSKKFSNIVIIHSSAGQPSSSTNSGVSQNQSPNQKRPPASHSSYGVETTCGPPPTYSTQRTFSQERIRKVDRTSQPRMQSLSSEPVQSSTLDDTPDADTTTKRESASSLIQSSPDTADTFSIPTPTDTENMASIQIRGEQRASADDEGKASSSDERKSEDLFLNIARGDVARQTQYKPEKRRTRISIPFLSGNRSSHTSRSPPIESPYDSNTTITAPQQQQPETSHSQSKRPSVGGPLSSVYSSRGYLLDDHRVVGQSSEVASDSERNEQDGYILGIRRSSTVNTDYNRLAHRSSSGLRHHRFASESIQPNQHKPEEQIATESTISTAAPSTVWDELDDLKSRIRKLELTGKLPASSAAAMGSSDRPKTATTAATTMSTSPKYRASEPTLPPAIEDTPTNLHPLLHEALDNAKAVVSHDIHQKLQATAQDALQIAAIMSTEALGARNYGAPVNNEKQLKRRAESMCRSLTELAISLAAEAKPAQSAARPGSRDHSLPPNSMLRSRRYSNDPNDRGIASSRVQSRLDSRRTSVHLGRNVLGNSSPERGSYHSPGAASHMPDPRMNRSSTLIRKRGGQGSFDGTNEQFNASPSIRPGSRAMTDLSAYRRISRDYGQTTREYTSQHPLPSPREQIASTASTYNTPVQHSHGTNFTSRRKYASPASAVVVQDSSPAVQREAWGRVSTAPMESESPDIVSEASGPGRQGSSTRSLGFASRIGSSVGSRLRAARTERDSREKIGLRSSRDLPSLVNGEHTTSEADFDTYTAENG